MECHIYGCSLLAAARFLSTALLIIVAAVADVCLNFIAFSRKR